MAPFPIKNKLNPQILNIEIFYALHRGGIKGNKPNIL